MCLASRVFYTLPKFSVLLHLGRVSANGPLLYACRPGIARLPNIEFPFPIPYLEIFFPDPRISNIEFLFPPSSASPNSHTFYIKS